MLLITGLGNPGAAYAGHRHNIGFRVVERIADVHGFGPWRSRFLGLASEGAVPSLSGDRVKVLLLKPQTYMNESGRSVGEAMSFFKLSPSAVVAFYDELDLAPGRFRMKTGGGAAGHNGVRSIIAQASPDVRRARLGIGHPGDKDKVLAHVLSDFAKADEPWVRALCDACARALPMLVSGEDEKYQAEVMRLAPAPKGDPRQNAAKE
ncbi:aminoacyl-tRNA hydrolase [bacterium]|nr:aminoacyl-tRNA hydrolase [bacterium]